MPRASSTASGRRVQGQKSMAEGGSVAPTPRLRDIKSSAGRRLKTGIKEFDFVLLTDGGHQPSTYAIKRTWDFFVRNLLGADPPAGYRMIAP